MYQFKNYSIIVLLAIMFTNISIRVVVPPNNPISWDTFGYYLYLPAAFIYNDLGLENKEVFDELITKYNSTSTFYQVTKSNKGTWIMKYSMGMAIFYGPSFFTGHAIANVLDYPADGFSKPYQWALVANGILFFFLGMFFMRKVLLRFFTDKITSLVLLLIFFGTNYFWYSTYSAEMPHNYLFAAYAFILWQTILWHENHKRKNMVWIALAIGFTTLARPTELIAILIPLLWEVSSKESFVQKYYLLIKYKSHILLFAFILLLIGSLQVIYWRIYSGNFIYYSYVNPGEGFEFLWPYTLRFLFSFRKGWLIYTPIMIFALWGFVSLYRNNKGVFFPVFIFFIVNLYIVSSWSCWWYAQSMGQRALVQSYALMAIPLGFFLTSLSRKSISVKSIFSLMIFSFVVLNLFQSWQLTKSIISADRMTILYYFDSFGKTKKTETNDKLLLVDRTYKGLEKLPDDQKFNHTVIKIFDFEEINENRKDNYSDLYAFTGSYSFVMDSNTLFSPAFKMDYRDLTKHDYAWLRVSVWVYPIHPISETLSSLIVSFQHKGKNYKYKGADLNSTKIKGHLRLNQWNKVSFDYLTPEVRSKKDNLIVYIWNRGKKNIYFDKLTIELFEPVDK
ncbi:MAG: hypothetical protein H8E34_10640 [Bacteroidetes bacterium]|nr:hypothetical protein [Bacteroidota bacterium]MBL6944253.1 hypothetical protein [Bacteroidales bacterium]